MTTFQESKVSMSLAIKVLWACFIFDGSHTSMVPTSYEKENYKKQSYMIFFLHSRFKRVCVMFKPKFLSVGLVLLPNVKNQLGSYCQNLQKQKSFYFIIYLERFAST